METPNSAEAAMNLAVVKDGVRQQMGEGLRMNPRVVSDGLYALREDRGVEVTNWHQLIQRSQALSGIMREEMLNELATQEDDPQIARKVLTVGRDLLHLDSLRLRKEDPDLTLIFAGLDAHLQKLEAEGRVSEAGMSQTEIDTSRTPQDTKTPGKPGLARRFLGGARDTVSRTIGTLDLLIPRPTGPSALDQNPPRTPDRFREVWERPLTKEDHERAWEGLTKGDKKLVDIYTGLKDRKPSDFKIQERVWLNNNPKPAKPPKAPVVTPTTPLAQVEPIPDIRPATPVNSDPLKQLLDEYGGSREAAIAANFNLFRNIPNLKTSSAEAIARLLEGQDTEGLVGLGASDLREIYTYLQDNSFDPNMKTMAEQKLIQLTPEAPLPNPPDTAVEEDEENPTDDISMAAAEIKSRLDAGMSYEEAAKDLADELRRKESGDK